MSPPAADLLIDLMLPEACTAVEAVAIGPISLWAFVVVSNESSIVTSRGSAVHQPTTRSTLRVEIVNVVDNL